MRKVFSQLIYGVGTLITHFMDEETEAWKGRVKVLNHTKPAGGGAKTQTQPMWPLLLSHFPQSGLKAWQIMFFPINIS